MYFVIGSRPNLAFTVTLLSQFSSCPNEIHLGAAKRALRYLAGTTDWDLIFHLKTISYSKYMPMYPMLTILTLEGQHQDM